MKLSNFLMDRKQSLLLTIYTFIYVVVKNKFLLYKMSAEISFGQKYFSFKSDIKIFLHIYIYWYSVVDYKSRMESRVRFFSLCVHVYWVRFRDSEGLKLNNQTDSYNDLLVIT
jgi:hypothetical protein